MTWIYANYAEYSAAIEDALNDTVDHFADGSVDSFLESATWEARACEEIRLIRELKNGI